MNPKKPFWRSWTFWSLLVLLVGFVLQWVATGEQPDGLIPLLGDLFQAAGIGGAMYGTISPKRAPLTLKGLVLAMLLVPTYGCGTASLHLDRATVAIDRTEACEGRVRVLDEAAKVQQEVCVRELLGPVQVHREVLP